MNDRLGDLPAWAGDSDDEDDFQFNNTPGGDVEMGDTNKQPKHMEHFFREVESIKTDIDAVKKATKSIGSINDKALQATTTEEENVLSRQLRPLIDQTNKQAKRTKTLLGLLKEETKKLQDANEIKQSDLRYVVSETITITVIHFSIECAGVSLILTAH
jgi:t-SNARE complex subunit (syntaxin)